MIAKKNPKVDLEKKRFAFFQIGLIVAGSLCLAAFEYASVEIEGEKFTGLIEESYILPPETAVDPEEFKQKEQPANVQREIINQVVVSQAVIQQGVVVTHTVSNITFDPNDETGYGNFVIEDKEEILPFAEIEPEFIGGPEAMSKWIAKHVVYPSLAAEMGLGGMAYVQFVVNTDGSIVNVVEVSEDGDLHNDLSKEAERVVASMPKWKPGEQAGKKVRVRYTIPIHFIAPR